jgi:hypothetical protein
MKPYQINIINSITLIIMGLWGYIASKVHSPTAFISVIAGILMLAFTKGLKNQNKIISHIVVILTLLMLIALIKPLTGSISRNNPVAIMRVLAMMLTCAIAMVFYIKSFMDARKS